MTPPRSPTRWACSGRRGRAVAGSAGMRGRGSPGTALTGTRRRVRGRVAGRPGKTSVASGEGRARPAGDGKRTPAGGCPSPGRRSTTVGQRGLVRRPPIDAVRPSLSVLRSLSPVTYCIDICAAGTDLLTVSSIRSIPPDPVGDAGEPGTRAAVGRRASGADLGGARHGGGRTSRAAHRTTRHLGVLSRLTE